MDREEFLERFISNQDINLDESTEGVEEDAWVLVIKGKVYEGILVRLQKLIEKNEGEYPLYLHIAREDELVYAGKIKRSIELINEMMYITRVLNSELYDKQGEEYKEVNKEDYIDDIRLDKMVDRDYIA